MSAGAIARLLPLLALASCVTMPAVGCDKAEKVRAAATLALRAVDRVCPLTSSEL